MTLCQLMTLADQHRLAAGTERQQTTDPADGASLLGFAAMRRT